MRIRRIKTNFYTPVSSVPPRPPTYRGVPANFVESVSISLVSPKLCVLVCSVADPGTKGGAYHFHMPSLTRVRTNYLTGHVRPGKALPRGDVQGLRG